MKEFSVLMSIYRNDKPLDVLTAFESVTIRQTLPPTEVVMMVDGTVPSEMERIVSDLAAKHPFLRVHRLPQNVGLGKALEIGMTLVSHEIVARMDADDIAMPNRFEQQIQFMEEHPHIAIVGGQISEFIDRPDNIVSYRNVPLTPQECRKYFQSKDPLNHMTVMFRKSVILAVGNYQPWHLNEDSYLWGRVLANGYEVANLPDVLVNVRVGAAMYARRGGYKYFKSDAAILRWKLSHQLTTPLRYAFDILVRFVVYVMMPNAVRGWFFKTFLRKQQ